MTKIASTCFHRVHGTTGRQTQNGQGRDGDSWAERSVRALTGEPRKGACSSRGRELGEGFLEEGTCELASEGPTGVHTKLQVVGK